MKPSNSEPPTNEPRPEEFELGSPESRAAARATLLKRTSIQQTITVLIESVDREGAPEEPWANFSPPKCTSRHLGKDGLLVNMAENPNPWWSDQELQSFIDRHPISRERTGKT